MINETLKKVLEYKYSNDEIVMKRIIEILFLAQECLNNNGLSSIEIRFTKRKDALGECTDNGDIILLQLDHVKYSDITLIKETILHEIAHALTSGEGHNIVWQAKALELGLSLNHIQRYKNL